MIEISNTFILVWLVVLAIICIYLLYMSLTRNNEADGLKSTISNLVRQNKKRDELINFLMERVETLTGAVNALVAQPVNPEIPKITPEHNQLQATTPSKPTEIIDQPHQPTHTTDITLDDVLNSIPDDELHQPEIMHALDAGTPTTQAATNITLQTTTPEPINTQQSLYFPEELSASEFSTVVQQPIINTTPHIATQSLNLDDVLNSIPTTFKDDDLISTILGADDSASQHGGEDHSNLPAEKIRLLGMNVKQLKQIAKDMNIKSRGNKTELVESIWEKMSVSAPVEIAIGTTAGISADISIDSNNEKETNVANSKLPELLVVEELPDDI
jgi:hypothetical protein